MSCNGCSAKSTCAEVLARAMCRSSVVSSGCSCVLSLRALSTWSAWLIRLHTWFVCTLSDYCSLQVTQQAALKYLCYGFELIERFIGSLELLSHKTHKHHSHLWDGVFMSHPSIIICPLSTSARKCLCCLQAQIFLELRCDDVPLI